MANSKQNFADDPYIETPFDIIGSYFRGRHLEQLARHQIESFNNFVSYQLPRTIEMFNKPEPISSELDYNAVLKKNSLEIYITFENLKLFRPQIHENNGAIKLMFPQEARDRNFTYSGVMTVDVNVKYVIRTGKELENVQTLYKVIKDVHIGKLPFMVKSSICLLTQYKHVDERHTGECKFDTGGYFIINGSEKTVLGQERAAENKIYCYNVSKSNTKFTWQAEIKSVPDNKCISPKQINLLVSSKSNGFGFPIYVQIPKIKQPVPLFIVFRALGIKSDKEICETILLDIEKEAELLALLQASVVDANQTMTTEDAVKYVTSFAVFPPLDVDKETAYAKKVEFTLDILNNDLFPHCQNVEQRTYFLGYMVNRLLQVISDRVKQDDRDSYLNKRIDLTGALLNNLFRNYFNKLVRDMERLLKKEINTGSWRSTDNYLDIITETNIYKIIKPTTIENGIKRALSTGDFSIKHAAPGKNTKVGVAQVLNRLTYVSKLSHIRRISTPIDKSGKLIPPRKLHSTSWGYLCLAETPEGQSVGVVKNLSVLAHVTIQSNSSALYTYVESFLDKMSKSEMYNAVKIFVNGAWVGVTRRPMELYLDLKDKKYKGIINIYTAIVFDYKNKEIRICNDAGRITRPVLKVKNQSILVTPDIVQGLRKEQLDWDDLVTSCVLNESIIEYIDPEEQNWSLIATRPSDLKNTDNLKYTHCEIHPSVIFGVLASCIPYPDHNQSPRNTYQCAQSKQAMGVYVSNFENRMDKTAYLLNYPMKPLVDTRLMNMIKLHKIPAGTNLIVAIMTHTGYNQEDSILVNQGSIDRGMALVTVFHTERDEDKQKLNGDEEIRCKPDSTKTKGMKMGNYNKVNSRGLIPENTLVENRDVIIAKVVPIKENRNDPTKVIKFEDQSRIYKTVEPTYIDKNYVDRNGDGYNFAKVRLRAVRKPVIGDKFCLTDDHDVLTLNRGWISILDVQLGDFVAQWDWTIHKIQYVNPLEVLEFDHEGEMAEVHNDFVSQKVTLNHRMWVVTPNEKDFAFHLAEDVLDQDLVFLSTSAENLTSVQYPMAILNKCKNTFKGKVYCLRVPSGVFLVRRFGRCSFTGNSSRHGQVSSLYFLFFFTCIFFFISFIF